MPGEASPGGDRVRAAEVIAALSLATDLGIGVPLEHGLHSTVFAMRLGERLGVDSETASQTYYACLLFAMEHGLVAWGQAPIPRTTGRL